MADAKVPLKFEIYKGDELIREEVLTQDVIKVGKLASSHLRIDDETVSRMHAVIEVTGPDEIHIIDLGSTRGTLVNGERVNKAKLQSGDEIMFGESRVVITFLAAQYADTAAPAPRAGRPAAGYVPPPPPTGFAAPPPQQSYAAPQHTSLAAGGVNPAAAEVEVHDGSSAIEVQTIYRDVVIGTRHLFNPQGKSTHSQGTGMLYGGLALAAISILVFVATAISVGKEKAEFEKWTNAGKEAKNFPWQPRSLGGDLVVFGGIAASLALCYMGLKRRGKTSPNFIIGSDADIDAPVSPDYVPSPSHPLVAATGIDYVVNVTPRMSGEVYVDNQLIPLQQFIQQRGSSFSLPPGGRARLDCGDTTFLISATARPRTLETPFLTWRWDEQVYTAGSALALALFLLMIFSVPPDPKSLSLDLFNSDNRFVKFLIKPPEEKEEEIPEWLKKKGPEEQGGKGKRHKGEEGKMGKKTSKNKEGLYGLKGPKDNPDPHLAKKLAEEQAKNAGILGVLKQSEGSHIASIFGRDTALGMDAEDVLGGLIGNQIGEAYGVGGLGLVGTGSGGGGTGEGTIGLGNLGTIGKGGGGGNGSGYGRGAGGLGGRRARAPDVIPGQANVRGSLDKEIIRRIIRRHINEVKYCYEQELTKKPDLGGRIMVQFTIAASGQVIASVLQNSTMGNARVENCTVQAVRRWEFPKPLGGGIVIVSYPFVLTPAGAGE
ncbi:MAG TPA: AgmX/PglI C-terminal domain-containing protein [Polyangia bacterium]|jgi:TonB family protein|nr:AgmX/PglI C-terminal domain-containing protein [Polyangia bacterium]